MAFCKHCGAEIDSDAAFCPSCGQKQEAVAETTEQFSDKEEAQPADKAAEQNADKSADESTEQPAAQNAAQSSEQSSAQAQNGFAQGSAAGTQYNTQDQYGNQNQYGGQPQYGNQNQYGNNMNGGYAGPQGQPYAAPMPPKKDKVGAGLFAIFLGSLGIHKFYLGYTTEGVIMLIASLIGGAVTCGIAPVIVEILAITEGVIYLTKTDEEFYQTYVVGRRGWC